MPSRIANIALTVHRDKKRINVNPGEKFNFTKEEIDDFTKLNKDALRLPVNEGGDEDNNAPANENLTNLGLPGGGAGKNAGGTPDNTTPDFDSMKVDELRDYAKKNELEVDLSLNKEPLLAAVKAAVADQEAL